MKPAVFCALAGTAVMLASTVDAHGQMLIPSYRPITATYRADCLYGLKGAGDDELEWAPIENLSQRGQADQPAAETFNIYNGCRGLVYETENNVTEIEAGVEFNVEYYIQAPHPGYMQLSIVKPSTDSVGKITYNQDTAIEYFSDFAESAGTFTVTATIPTNVTGCENAGDCALQFFWYSSVANQTYPTCADITIPGSGAGSSATTTTTTSSATSAVASTTSSDAADTTTTTAPAATTTAPAATTATPAATTATPSATTATEASDAADAEYDDDSTADEASAADEASTATDASTDDTTATATTTDAPVATTASTDAPAATTATPTATTATATTTATTTSSDSDKCSVRRRRRMRQ